MERVAGPGAAEDHLGGIAARAEPVITGGPAQARLVRPRGILPQQLQPFGDRLPVDGHHFVAPFEGTVAGVADKEAPFGLERPYGQHPLSEEHLNRRVGMAVVKLANQPEVEPGEADGVRLAPHERNIGREHFIPGVQRQRTVRSIIFDDVPQPEERQQVEPAIHLRGRIEPLVAQRKIVITRSVFHCSHAEVVVLIALGITQLLQQLRELPAQQHGVGRPPEVGRLDQVIRSQRLFALDPVGGVISQRAYPVEQVPVAGHPVGMHDPRQQGKEGAVDIDATQRVTEDRMVVLHIAPDTAEGFEIPDSAGILQSLRREVESGGGGGRDGRLLGLHDRCNAQQTKQDAENTKHWSHFTYC